jgi:nucleotide-binding universal stress UspA family protein
MTKKILCATDGTSHSGHAIQIAAELSAKLGADLSICTVNVARGGDLGPLISSM